MDKGERIVQMIREDMTPVQREKFEVFVAKSGNNLTKIIIRRKIGLRAERGTGGSEA